MGRSNLAGYRTTSALALAAAAVVTISLGAAGEAHATDTELDSCGGVLLEGSASCEVLPTETCTTECNPVACEEVCAYRLTTTCEEECQAEAEVDCQPECETTCVDSCTTTVVDDQPPNCMG